MKKNKINLGIFLVVFLLLVLVFTKGFSYAKYASNTMFNYYLNSKGFYFESDELSLNNNEIVDTMWNGEDVVFSLTNTSKGNNSTEYDIEYEVTCKVLEGENKTCFINGISDTYKGVLSANFGCSDSSQKNRELCESTGGEWVAKKGVSQLKFGVIGEDGQDLSGAKVKITVTSTKPYKKILSATYNLIKDSQLLGSLTMNYSKNRLKSNLVISNSYNENKCVMLKWDSSKFAFDGGSVNELNVSQIDGDIDSVYFMVDKMSSVLLEFFEIDEQKEYDENYFNLIESDLCEVS